MCARRGGYYHGMCAREGPCYRAEPFSLSSRYNYGGHEVEIVGDSFFATFASPASAVRCACAIREALKALEIAVRIGVHAGEVESDGEALIGLTIHIGSRVTGIAAPGEVVVSSTVRDLVAGSGITFTERGTHILRGIPGEWRLFLPDVPAVGVHPSSRVGDGHGGR
jgi:class 3 adenylate cyclase